MSSPTRLLLRLIISTLLVWLIATNLSHYLLIRGGWKAYIIVGILITLLNALARPFLALLFAPLRLLSSLLVFLIINWVFLWLILYFVVHMSPNLIRMQIIGLSGWFLLTIILGLSNWVMRHML